MPLLQDLPENTTDNRSLGFVDSLGICQCGSSAGVRATRRAGNDGRTGSILIWHSRTLCAAAFNDVRATLTTVSERGLLYGER